MLYTVLAHLVTFLLDHLCLARQSEHAKDLEILALRQHLRILQRAQSRPARPAHWEKVILALCVSKLKALRQLAATVAAVRAASARTAAARRERGDRKR